MESSAYHWKSLPVESRLLVTTEASRGISCLSLEELPRGISCLSLEGLSRRIITAYHYQGFTRGIRFLSLQRPPTLDQTAFYHNGIQVDSADEQLNQLIARKDFA